MGSDEMRKEMGFDCDAGMRLFGGLLDVVFGLYFHTTNQFRPFHSFQY